MHNIISLKNMVTATVSLQVPTHACKMFPSANMSRSDANDQVNVSAEQPVAAEPRTRVFEARPSEVYSAGRARPVIGPAKRHHARKSRCTSSSKSPNGSAGRTVKGRRAADLAIQSAASLPGFPE